jgi:hypothetical protein
MVEPGSDTPRALADLDLQALVGVSHSQARAAIEAAGGQLRAIHRNQPVTLEYRPNRVTLVVVNDQVVSVIGIG